MIKLQLYFVDNILSLKVGKYKHFFLNLN